MSAGEATTCFPTQASPGGRSRCISHPPGLLLVPGALAAQHPAELPEEEKEGLVWGSPGSLELKEVGPNTHFALEWGLKLLGVYLLRPPAESAQSSESTWVYVVRRS